MRKQGLEVIRSIDLKHSTIKPCSDHFVFTGVVLKLVHGVLETKQLLTISSTQMTCQQGAWLHQRKQLAERDMLPR